MKFRSFRLRIAFMAAGLAGTALIGFSMAAWWLIRGARIDRLDAQLEVQVLRLARPRNLTQWSAMESTLPAEIGVGSSVPVLVLVSDRQGTVLYQSETQSDSLYPDATN
jgi:hypothetical protein